LEGEEVGKGGRGREREREKRGHGYDKNKNQDYILLSFSLQISPSQNEGRWRYEKNERQYSPIHLLRLWVKGTIFSHGRISQCNSCFKQLVDSGQKRTNHMVRGIECKGNKGGGQ
jgi:hypothetical protein